jgi:hypothetical protein
VIEDQLADIVSGKIQLFAVTLTRYEVYHICFLLKENNPSLRIYSLTCFNICSDTKFEPKLETKTVRILNASIQTACRDCLQKKDPAIGWSRVSQNLGDNKKFQLGWVPFVIEQGVSEEITQKSCRKYLQNCIFYLS